MSKSEFIAQCKSPGLRKRKRKLAPLEFIEDPLDASFNSPDRPCAAQNPVGAPTVNALDLNNSWASFKAAYHLLYNHLFSI